eukprot:TRINITY_DN27467_c0_g1_i1.p1 TRINITY_DN27467_c0_g1~~TRINITY_DN27467_c0_g1_i1.p1  ORF type:complete len:437 (-),score=39.27 TRINITY_DN27467_c0_g1_i1:118-1428(-)
MIQNDSDLSEEFLERGWKTTSVIPSGPSRWSVMAQKLDPQWWLLLPILMMQFTGIALVIPALPNYKLRFFGGHAVLAAHVQSISDSTRAFLTILVSGELGRLSDTMGRRPIVFLSIASTMAPLLSLAVTSNLYPYFVLFSLAGALGGQNSPAVSAYIADCSPKEARTKNFGMTGSVVSGVWMLMPAVGGLISQRYGEQNVFKVAVAFEVLAGIAVFMLPESLPLHQRQPHEFTFSLANFLQPVRSLAERSDAFLCRLALVRLLYGLSANGTKTVIFFFLAAEIGSFSDADFGTLLTLMGLSGILGQVFLLRLLLRASFSELFVTLIAILAAMLQSVGWILLPYFPSKGAAFAIMSLSGISSMSDPAFAALVTEARHDDIGLMLGVFNAVDGLTSLMAPLVFSFLFSMNPLGPFALSMAVNACAAILIGVLIFQRPR